MNAKGYKIVCAFVALATLASPLSCAKFRQTTKNLNDPKYACSIDAMLSTDGPVAARRCYVFLNKDFEIPVGQKYLLAENLDAQGEPGRAFELFKTVIREAHKKEKFAPEATAAAMSLVAQRGRVARFDQSFLDLWADLSSTQGELPAPAWFQLKNLRMSILRKQGKLKDANEAQSNLGCITTWRTAGPFGPNIWTGFDTLNPLETSDQWPRTVELGWRMQPSNTGVAKSMLCNVSSGDPRVEFQGTVVNQTKVLKKTRGPVFFRMQTGLAASILIDGIEVFRRDPRVEHPAFVQWFKVGLEKGNHRISLKLSGANPASPFSLVALDQNGSPAFVKIDFDAQVTNSPQTDEIESISPIDETATSGFPALRAALWWDDHPALEQLWRSQKDMSKLSPLLQTLRAETRFIDQSLPGDLAYEEARALYEQALTSESRLLGARLKLADHASLEARNEETLELLNEGVRLSPNEPEYLSRLAGLYLSEGWYPEAQEVITKLGSLLPVSCDAMLWKLALARSLGRAAKSRKLAEEIFQCDHLSAELLDQQTLALNLSSAKKTASELIEMFPVSPGFVERKAYLEMARGNLVGFGDYLRQAIDLEPKDPHLYLRLADSQLAAQDKAAARATLQQAENSTPRPSPSLLRAKAHLMGKDYMADYRVDGLSLIQNYQNDPPSYDTAAVYVLDRAVYLYEDDGSNVILVHMIMHLTSDEAVEAHGEVQIPHNAETLIARTIKPDGRVLEPVGIEGKETLSLPGIVPGDFIEVEYVAYNEPNPTYPGGFDSQRFFFQDFQTAFHFSQVLVVVPKEMKVSSDLRGPSPNMTVTTKGQYKTYTWQAQEILPHTEEPFGPDPVEYLPSTRVVSNVTLRNIADRVRDMLADKSVPAAIGPQIVGQVCPDQADKKDCRRRLYHWVLSAIEPSGDPFEQASHILHRRAGDRNHALEYLLRVLGDKPRLALVKSLLADQSDNAIPSINEYSHTALYLPQEGWLSLDVDNAPFGYMLPDLTSQKAVFIDNAETTLTGKTATPSDGQSIKIHVSKLLSPNPKIRVTEILTGAAAANWRTVLEDGSQENILRVFAEQYVSLEIPGAVLEDLTINGLHSPDADLELAYLVSLPGYLSIRDRNSIGKDLFATGLLGSTGALPNRITDLVMPIHLKKEVEVLIDRESFSKIELPYLDGHSISTKWGTLETSVSSTQNTTGYRYKLTLDIKRIAATDYLDFATFAKEVDQITKIEPVFVP